MARRSWRPSCAPSAGSEAVADTPSASLGHLRRVLRGTLADAVAERAVERGLLGPAALAAARARREAAGDEAPVVDALIEEGLLDPADLRALEEELAREAIAMPAALRSKARPPEVEEAARDPARVMADLVLVNLVGRGGAGEVWKSWDRSLERWVAVKISTASLASVSARERFEREAAAVARLRHPNIVPVFAAGADRGRPYLVMPLIDGRTLAETRLEPRQALEVIRTVALAAEYAHQQGIIHRDLKPGNVMIDSSGVVFVLDFGLVFLRDEQADDMTRPGDLLGTAGYMAPEQIRGGGEARLATTDVYGLGATLYHLLAGRAPFRGDSLPALLAQVANEDPTPVRTHRPELSREVEAVVAKAMDRDPSRRYPSAAALAEDLGRLLDGVPVSARPSGRLGRAVRRLRRRPAVVAVAGALALAGGGLLAAGARAKAERREAVEALNEVGRVSLEAALRLRRAGQAQGMRSFLPPLEAAYGRVSRLAPELALADHLMGRMFRALMDDERALALQDRALAKDPGFAPALYERAVLASRMYRRRLREALPQTQATKPPPSIHVVEQRRPGLARLRETVVRDLRSLRPLPHAQLAAQGIEGLLAYHESRHEDARRLLSAVLDAEPQREEIWETLAHTEEAERRWAAAGVAYTQGLFHDRGYLPLLLGRCQLRLLLRKFEDAIEDAGTALASHPETPEAWHCRAAARAEQARELMMTGRDGREIFAAAERDFHEALARRPDFSSALLARGTMYRWRARAIWRWGQDPTADIVASERDLSRAVEVDPPAWESWTSRGRTRAMRADLDVHQGGDARPAFAGAETDFDEAIRLGGADVVVWQWRGDLRARRALYHLEQGLPADEDFAAAEADFVHAPPSHEPWAFCLRGTLRFWRGRGDVRAGRDPMPAWAAAQADLDQAVRGLSAYPDAWTLRAALARERAAYLARRGRSGARDRAAAAADLERALTIDPAYLEARSERRLLRLDRGDRRGAREDPDRVLRQAPPFQ